MGARGTQGAWRKDKLQDARPPEDAAGAATVPALAHLPLEFSVTSILCQQNHRYLGFLLLTGKPNSYRLNHLRGFLSLLFFPS